MLVVGSILGERPRYGWNLKMHREDLSIKKIDWRENDELNWCSEKVEQQIQIENLEFAKEDSRKQPQT